MTKNHTTIPKSIPVSYPNLVTKLNKLYCLSKNIFHGKITLVYTLDS